MRPNRGVLRGIALIRRGRDDDAPLFIALITRCWADYENCTLDVDVDDPELRALASAYARKNGALWIAGEGDGMIATRPSNETTWEVCRVYVMPAMHGTGLAAILLDTAERHAAQSGATELELWTDTRFERAHRFYEKHGYLRQPDQRSLTDVGGPFVEFRYLKRSA